MNVDPEYVEGLVPFVHVRDLVRSTTFYEHFGFKLRNTYEKDGRRVWCWLERHQARPMLAEADAPWSPPNKPCCSGCTSTSWKSCTAS
jgi:hypothetical protein